MLKLKLDSLQERLNLIDQASNSLKVAIDELVVREKELRSKRSLVESKKKIVQDYLKILADVSSEVLLARDGYLLLKQEKIESAEQALMKLQSICKHQLVLGYKSWRGWACENYYDGHSGKRMCVICGFKESPWNTYNDDLYKVLVQVPNRIFGEHFGFRPIEDFYDRDGNLCVRYIEGQSPPLLDIWQPLENLLPIFETGELGDILSSLSSEELGQF